MKLRLIRYIVSEILPGLFLGIGAFIFVLLMFQVLRLMEFFLIHGVSFNQLFQILWSLSISFIPALLPMATLFSVVLAFSRFSNDSESVAMISLGISPNQLLIPILSLGFILSIISSYTSFQLAPNGNRQSEIIMHELSQTKITSTIKENAFTESFSNLVIFTYKADSKTGLLEKVFIFDEQSSEVPLTIVAQSGQISQSEKPNSGGLWLKLINGDIHRQEKVHTKINFGELDVKLMNSKKHQANIEKSPISWTLEDIKKKLANPESLTPKELKIVQTEYHKRFALGTTCFILSFLGFTLGFNPNRRIKTNGFVLSLILIVGYWLLLVTFENLAHTEKIPPLLGAWIPNIIYMGLGFWRYLNLKK